MSANTHGEVDWSNEGGGNGGSGGGKVEWLKLSQGKHKIRLLTKPHKYPTHKNIKAKGEPGFGRKVPCSAEYTGTGKETKYVEGTCPICDASQALSNKKLRPTTMYMFWVLDRATGTSKVIDVSYQIFSQIKGLTQDENWGDPQGYDISIAKNPNSRGPSDYYLVVPIPNTTMSVSDQQVRDTVDMDYIQKKTAPWTLEAVQKVLDKVLDGGEMHIPPVEEKEEEKPGKTQTKSNGNGSSRKATAVPATELVADAASNDLEDAFPSYDQAATN
jgi:hypothetical protein